MKIELKNIKHSEFASEETFSYEANLYVEGKPFAQVSNDGKGGADHLYQDDRFKDLEAWKKCYALLKIHCADKFRWNMDDCFKSQSNVYGWREGTIETACHELMTDHLIRKDFKKELRKPCYIRDGGLSYFNVSAKTPNIFDKIRRQLKKPDLVFLNEMPEAEALTKYMEVAQ